MSTTEDIIGGEMAAIVNNLSNITEKYRKSNRTDVLAMLAGVRAATETLTEAMGEEEPA